MSDRRRLTSGELEGLGDDQLVAYIARMRECGHNEAAREAAAILAFGLEGLIKFKVGAKVPRVAIEDVTMEVLESVTRSNFDGKTLVGFRAFLNTIIQRRIADFHRSEERRPNQDPLRSEHSGDEEIWGPEPTVEDATEMVALLDAVERILAGRNPLHRLIIELYGPDPIGAGLSAAGVVERVGAERDGEVVSADNVQQIWRRFKVELEGDLDWGEDGGNPDG